MKTIKFRAWDKQKKEIREVTDINWYHEYMWVDETLLFGDRLPIANTPIMQFTGLLDKNGKEIFEGDVINGKHSIVGNWTAKVDMLPTGIWFGGAKFTEIVDFSVIGNVHENPELLA